MSAVSTHRAVSTEWIKQVLRADHVLDAPGTLRNLRATSLSGEQKAISGIYYRQRPQEIGGGEPGVVIGPPYPVSLPMRMHPNGDGIVNASFGQDVWIAGNDIAPDDPGLDAMLGRIITLLNGQSGSVDGGLVTHCRLSDMGYVPEKFTNDGGLISALIGANFTIATKVT